MYEERDRLVTELEKALASDDPERLRRQVPAHHPADLASALAGLEAEQQLALLASLPAETAAVILAELDELSCRHLVRDLPEERLRTLLAELAPQTVVGLLEHLDGSARERVVAGLAPPLRSAVHARLVHPEDSAGRIMDTIVPTVPVDVDVARAIEALRSRFGEADPIDAVFAVDDRERLVGRLSPARLLLARADRPVAELLDREGPAIPPGMDQEEVADLAVRYDLVALPVVDEDRRLIGLVHFDDVFDVIEEEDVEDLSYAVGTGTDAPTDRTAARAIRARLPWLFVGLAGGLGSAAVLGAFEHALEQVVRLAFFVPAVLGLAGAVAVQSSSLTVRGLAGGSLSPRRLPAVALRELRVALGMGLALGTLLGIAAFLSSGGDARLGLVLFLVLVVVLMAAAIGGTVIPIVLERLGVDPAVAMGPFVTTLSDLVALAIYMTIATLAIG